MIRLTRRLGATAALATVLLVALAGPAAAHTEAEATAGPDGRTRVTLTVAVECADGDAATTGLRVQLPEGASDVHAENQPGWTSEVGPSEVAWQSPAPTVDQKVFTLEMVVTQAVGETVYLPALQECPSGEEIAWIQVPSTPGETLDHPAPSFVVPANATTPTSAAVTTTAPATSSTTEPRMALEQTPVTQEGSETRPAGLIVFIVILVVILGGAAILYLRHRRTGNTTPRA